MAGDAGRLAERPQRRLEREQARGLIIDEQNVDRVEKARHFMESQFIALLQLRQEGRPSSRGFSAGAIQVGHRATRSSGEQPLGGRPAWRCSRHCARGEALLLAVALHRLGRWVSAM